MSEAPGSNESCIEATLAAHRCEDGALGFDLIFLEARDLEPDRGTVSGPPGKVGAAERFAAPDRVLLGIDSLSGNGSGDRHALLRDFAASRGIERVLPFSSCGFVAAEVAERGLAMPGEVVVGRSLAGHALGGVGAIFVRTEAAVRSAAIARVVPPLGAPLRVVLRGDLDRWVSPVDVGLALVEELAGAGLKSRPVELSGTVVLGMSIPNRMILCGVLGARQSAPVVAPVDGRTVAWLRARSSRYPRDPDAASETAGARADLEFDVSNVLPSFAERDRPRREVCDVEPTDVDAVLVGGAFGGGLDDLRMLAHLLREHPIASAVRLVVVPATPRTLIHAAHEGIVAMLVRAGARIEAPGSRYLEDLERELKDDGEPGLTTAFDEGPLPGWMLASPAVCAASAVFGRIAHPDEVLRRPRESV